MPGDPRGTAGLVVLGGLPGVGKTTIARELARRTGAVHVRVDTIEECARSLLLVAPDDLTVEGYVIGYAVAADQLLVGLPVVADSVNPVAVTRQAWRDVAVTRGLPCIEVEVICSAPDEHRRRAEERTPETPGVVLPSWDEIVSREIEPWTPDIVIDTADLEPGAAVATICAHAHWLQGGLDG